MEELHISIEEEVLRGDLPKNERTEIFRVKSNDHGDRFEKLSYVNQKLETSMQSMEKQMATSTATFMSLGMLFLHAIVQHTIPLQSTWWIPFCIFLLVSIIYWHTIQTIIRDYFWVRRKHGLTLDLLQTWSGSAENGTYWMEKSCFSSIIVSWRKNSYLFVVLVALSAFNVVILYACYSFLDVQSA